MLFVQFKIEVFSWKTFIYRSRPFEVVMMTQYGAMEIRNNDKSSTFLVNGK